MHTKTDVGSCPGSADQRNGKQLHPGSKHGEGSLWDTLTKDFSAFLVKKVLKARMQDIEISVPSKESSLP